MKTFPALLVIPLLVACAAVPGDSAAGPQSPPASAPRSSISAPEGIPQDVWQVIISDLEGREGAVTNASVLTAEAVTWSDGGLGCPQEGEMYTQALVDGYQVVIEVAGTEYDYRVGNGTDVRLCENPPVGG